MTESVAAGAEELNASVREISEAMTKSRETASARSNACRQPMRRHSVSPKRRSR
jgi:hypothetical protein